MVVELVTACFAAPRHACARCAQLKPPCGSVKSSSAAAATLPTPQSRRVSDSRSSSTSKSSPTRRRVGNDLRRSQGRNLPLQQNQERGLKCGTMIEIVEEICGAPTTYMKV